MLKGVVAAGLQSGPLEPAVTIAKRAGFPELFLRPPQQTITIFSGLRGAMLLARAVDGPALCDEILVATSTADGTRSTGAAALKSKVPVTD